MTVNQKRFLITFIDAHKADFSAGNTVSRAWLLSNFTATFPKLTQRNVVKQNMAILAVYCTINQILHKYGLHMAARDYYNHFDILTKADVDNKIKSYRQVSSQKMSTAAELSLGKATNNCKLKRFSKPVIARLVASI